MPTNKHFKDIKTCFCFLDETGLIHSDKDKFFALGIIKCSNPEKIYNKIRKIRQKYNYNEEMKWSELTRKIRFNVAREMFDIFLTENAEFNGIILDKDKLDFEKHYNNNLNKAYRSFSISLLKLIIGKNPDEVLIILADDYFTPVGIDLEVTIKKFINDHYKKFVVAGVCQIDSKSSDLLQLTDLILGAIVYDLKKREGIVQKQNEFKKKFLNFVYQKLNVKKEFFVHNWIGSNIPNYISSEIHRREYFIPKGKIRATIFDYKKSKRKIE
jgi:hypothetical protein